jgi:hypothetical protein
MKTAIIPGNGTDFTDQQLECLCVLADGEWHDRNEIRQKMGLKTIHSNVSSRLIGPLVEIGLVEQEERPLKDGSKKIKKVIRFSKDIDEYVFFYIISNSAERLAVKYCRNDEKNKLYSEMVNAFQDKIKMQDADFEKEQEDLEVKENGPIAEGPYPPAWLEIQKIAKRIEKYCRTPADACVAAMVARPDLYEEYREQVHKMDKDGA